MIASLKPPRTGMEAYQMLPEGTYCQLINDQIIMSPAPIFEHQTILLKIFRQIDAFVIKNGLGEVYFAPVDVYLNDTNVFQPDLFYFSNENKHKKQENGFHGAPDLVIEVLSKGNSKYDNVQKKKVYEKSVVKEYWLIEPTKKICKGYVLRDNDFNALPITNEGFTIKLFDLFISLE